MEEKMANCPACGKPILNEGQFESYVKFNIKCPWCQTRLQIKVRPGINVQPLKEEKTVVPEPEFAARLPYRD